MKHAVEVTETGSEDHVRTEPEFSVEVDFFRLLLLDYCCAAGKRRRSGSSGSLNEVEA